MERAWKIIEGTGKIIEGARQVGSYVRIDESVETLKRKCEDLGFRAEDVKTEVENAESSSGAKRRKTVGNWMVKVENLRNQIDGIDAALSQSGILERPQLANKIKNLTEQAEELLKQGELRQGLTLNTPHDEGVELLTKPLVGQAFEENHEKIWEYLMEPDVLTIGIWGMGGVGKTTLVKHIHNRAQKQRGTFSDVFWVTVSQNLDIRKLQDKLADGINLPLNNEQDEMKRAAMLYRELEKRSCLFILDDVWQCTDFHKVGIPVKVNGCKAIITTRSLNVCRMIDCQREVKVEPLSKGEAWDLFQMNLGRGEALSPDVLKVASRVARECAGLPLGIITVARGMRGVNDAREWRCALKELGESKQGLVEMEEEVFHVLKFSYNRLRDPKVQQSFLYCALYPEDYQIKREELVHRLIDEGIIEANGSWQDQFDCGHTILNQLVRSSLLEETVQRALNYEDEECVKMHDLLRDMAISMKSTEFMVKSGMQLEELPGEQEWTGDTERVSLMKNYIKEIVAVSPRCPKLLSLLLSNNLCLKRIGNSFFQHMPSLQVLDLTDCREIEELPDSVLNLKNLIALVLHDCMKLWKLPSLAELKSLKHLDLGFTHIVEVPHGLEKLVNLTYLDLRTRYRGVFPTEILPQLLLLEFLAFNESVKIKEEQLKNLERLSTFRGKLIFDDVNGFRSYLMSRRTRRGPNCSYNFELNNRGEHVSEEYKSLYYLNCARVGGLNISKRSIPGVVDVETLESLIKDVQSLELEKCYGARNLCDVSWLDNAAHNLKQFQLWGCESVQCLVPCSGSCPYFLQNLEKLTLMSLKNLEVLFELRRGENGGLSSSTLSLPPPPAVGGAFSCLKVLHIFFCNKIKILFHPSFMPNLQKLEEISVDYCIVLQEIKSETISEGETSTSIEYALPNLATLTLRRLPQLKSICRQTISCPSLSEITVVDCPQLKRMPLSNLPSSLESISVDSEEWLESAEWDHPNAKEHLKPYLSYLYRRGKVGEGESPDTKEQVIT